MMNKPKVSIVIPVYNGSNYLKYAIDCALSQTYENTEIIVVNDGSTDDGQTEAIARSYGDRIRYFAKPNGGVSSALNYGIAQMTGDYFSWLSHDDGYTPDKVQNGVDLLERHGQLGGRCLAFTGGWFIDAKGDKLRNFPVWFEPETVYTGENAIRCMIRKGTLNGCCMLIPKAAFAEAGLFDETLRYSQDALMWYRIFLAGYGLVSDDRLNVTNRIHASQVSQRRKDLYMHDARVIAELLAEPLAKADPTGDLLIQYIRRLTRHQCKDAIDYLYHYAEEQGFLNARTRAMLGAANTFGWFRNKATYYVRTMMVRLRK